jgi:hypothetical protein
MPSISEDGEYYRLDQPPPYTDYQHQISLDCITYLSTFHITQYLGIQVFYQIHQFTTYHWIEAVTSIYCQDQIEVFSRETGSILLITQVGIQETEALLSEVGPCCINSWIPRLQDHRLITLKVLRNIILELFEHQLPQ